MTNRIAVTESRRRLALIWCSGFLVSAAIIFAQTIGGHYSSHAGAAWSWYAPMVVPTLSFIIGGLVREQGKNSRSRARIDRRIHRLAFTLSSVFLITLVLTIVLQPLSDYGPVEILSVANAWLTPIQSSANVSLGICFGRTPTEDI